MMLIDADALMKLAHNHINGTVDCNDIARFPTVDAVEVVRCKDCRFWVHEFDNVGHCTYAGIHLDHADYGFCSYGERKEEHADDQCG